MQSKEIGQWFLLICLLFFLCTDWRFASFQLVGKVPVVRHFWYIMHRGSAISDEQILSMCAEMPSGSFAFLLLSLQMMDDIFSFEIFMRHKSCLLVSAVVAE